VKRMGWLYFSVALATAASMGAGCAGEPEPVPSSCPDFVDAEFSDVAAVLERKCGSLDCHGQAERSFVVFGQNGQRRPGGGVVPATTTGGGGGASGTGGGGTTGSGGGGTTGSGALVTGGVQTTSFERAGTYQSLCALQPEVIAEVVAGDKPPTELTVVRKASLREAHKGGQVWLVDSPGDICLQSWFQGDLNDVACRQTP